MMSTSARPISSNPLLCVAHETLARGSAASLAEIAVAQEMARHGHSAATEQLAEAMSALEVERTMHEHRFNEQMASLGISTRMATAIGEMHTAAAILAQLTDLHDAAANTALNRLNHEVSI
ncbi:MAG: hypothetical protein JWM36_3214 [Hyphomicrobiales bacterium]|nr:hypothetical protein [Hyphomicrobiales bacterium]